jgi:hypothetical protein
MLTILLQKIKATEAGHEGQYLIKYNPTTNTTKP